MERTLTLVVAIGMAAVGCGGAGTCDDSGCSSSSWLVGSSGALLSSSDGVSYRVRSAGTGVDLLGLYCVNSQHGWSTGADGTLLRTIDSGLRWTTEGTGTNVALRAVAFADEEFGLAVGDGGTLLRSGDGGQSWTPIQVATSEPLRAVAITRDRTRAWAVGDHGTLLRSTDGAHSFVAVNGLAGYDVVQASLRAVRFADDGLHGFVAADDGSILMTVDGGAHWTTPAQAPGALRGLSVTRDGTRIVAVGAAGLVWRSVDGGKSFGPVESGSTRALNAIGFSEDNSLVGWAIGEQATILRTVDGAASFASMHSPVDADFNAVEDF
jgi:photosystem II stability/assembly factor-like uncharacterized protein